MDRESAKLFIQTLTLGIRDGAIRSTYIPVKDGASGLVEFLEMPVHLRGMVARNSVAASDYGSRPINNQRIIIPPHVVTTT